MNKTLVYIEEFISAFMLTDLSIFVLLMLMQFDRTHEIHYVGLLWVPIYIVCIYVINAVVTSIFAAFPLLVVCGTMVKLFAVNLPEFIFDIIVAVLLLIIAIYSRSVDDRLVLSKMPIELVVVFLPVYWFSRAYNIDNITKWVFLGALIYLVTGLIEIYLDNLLKYLDNTRGSSEVALKSLIKTDSSVFLCFVGLIVVGLVAVFLIPKGAINAIKNFLLDIVRGIINGILFLISLTGRVQFVNVRVNYEELIGKVNPIVPKEIWIIPEFILKVIVVIAIVRVAYVLIRNLTLHLMKYRGLEYDKITFTSPRLSKRNASKLKTENKTHLSRYNPRENVRLMFIKLVKEHEYTLKHLYKNATAKDIAKTMELEELNDYGREKDYSKIAKVYEKARYSNEAITREDITTMRRS